VGTIKERMTGTEWAGVLLTVLGAVALAMEAEASQGVIFSGVRLSLLLGVSVFLSVALLLVNRQSQRPEVLLALVVGLCFGMGSILTKALTVESSRPELSIFTWAVVLNPLLLAVVLANVLGLVLLQAAFQRGRAAVVVPLQLAMANGVTVLAGVMVFAEHITLLRGTGMVLIVVGTALLQFKPSSDSKRKD
jgi:drug/metabolite transporter (DMT)-like permease